MEPKENIMLKSTAASNKNNQDDNNVHALEDFKKLLHEKANHHLGYPFVVRYEESAVVAPLLSFHVNNLGDPFLDSNYGLNSKAFEIVVLDWFAHLWEIEKEEYWGYITTGGTEGNLHGILIGRELHPDGILYASSESHYSIFKAARMYRMKLEVVDALITGEIDYQDLKAKLLRNKGKPSIINANIGTTFRGGVDNIDQILEILEGAGFSEDQFYIHCDAALSGLIIPFVKTAFKVSFTKAIGSVSVSGHKFLGSPIPCGVQLTRKKYISVLSRNIEYIGAKDVTILGSRNGHTPLFMWHTLKTKGLKHIEQEVEGCIERACFLHKLLKKAGIGSMLNDFSITVVLERPLDDGFVHKWQLACEGSLAHVIVMPMVTVDKIQKFVAELAHCRSKWLEEHEIGPPCVANYIGETNCECETHTSHSISSNL